MLLTRSATAWILDFARVSVLSLKDFQVAGTGDCRMRRQLPTQAGDEPLRYIFLSARTGGDSPFAKTRMGTDALDAELIRLSWNVIRDVLS